jgi:hypothetical protein
MRCFLFLQGMAALILALVVGLCQDFASSQTVQAIDSRNVFLQALPNINEPYNNMNGRMASITSSQERHLWSSSFPCNRELRVLRILPNFYKESAHRNLKQLYLLYQGSVVWDEGMSSISKPPLFCNVHLISKRTSHRNVCHLLM